MVNPSLYSTFSECFFMLFWGEGEEGTAVRDCVSKNTLQELWPGLHVKSSGSLATSLALPGVSGHKLSSIWVPFWHCFWIHWAQHWSSDWCLSQEMVKKEKSLAPWWWLQGICCFSCWLKNPRHCAECWELPEGGQAVMSSKENEPIPWAGVGPIWPE